MKGCTMNMILGGATAAAIAGAVAYMAGKNKGLREGSQGVQQISGMSGLGAVVMSRVKKRRAR